MSNPLRGEVTVDVNGHTRTMRLTFDALIRIESTLGEGIISIALRLGKGTVFARDIHAILAAALEASGYGNDDVAEALLHDGLATHAETCAVLLAAALNGKGEGTEAGKP